MRKALKTLLGLIWAALLYTPAFAHDVSSETASFENLLGALALRIVLISAGILGGISLVAMLIGKKKRSKAAPRLFGMMVSVIAVVTIYLIGSTIYLNSVSYTKGPVHWHADFEIWTCGKPFVSHNGGSEVDKLRNPSGFLSNKIGSPTIHEHNDRRMHIEGVLMEPEEASLGNFFAKLGGHLEDDSLELPTNDGLAELTNGDLCDGVPGEVQVFVNQIKDRKVVQTKLEDPESYVISPNGAVPPGDCVIIEFDKPKTSTNKTCVSYEVAEQTGKVTK